MVNRMNQRQVRQLERNDIFEEGGSSTMEHVLILAFVLMAVFGVHTINR